MATDNMNDSIEFEQHIKELGDRQLLEYVARTQYANNKLCTSHASQIANHEDRLLEIEGRKPSNTKQLISNSASGGITGAIVGSIIMLVEYFKGH